MRSMKVIELSLWTGYLVKITFSSRFINNLGSMGLFFSTASLLLEEGGARLFSPVIFFSDKTFEIEIRKQNQRDFFRFYVNRSVSIVYNIKLKVGIVEQNKERTKGLKEEFILNLYTINKHPSTKQNIIFVAYVQNIPALQICEK